MTESPGIVVERFGVHGAFGRARSRDRRRSFPCCVPSGASSTKRHAPPTVKSTSQTTSDWPCGPNQRLSSSGLLIASKTSWRGASKTRVSTISRSDGVVTFSVPVFNISVLLVWLRCCLEFVEQVVEPSERALPELAVVLQPSVGLGETLRLQPARPALGVATA